MKLIKIFTIIVLLITIIFCLGTKIQAFGDLKQNSNISGMNFTSPLGSGTPNVDERVLNAVGVIISIIKAISAIAAVISLIIIGIQYMTGSIEGKTDGKKKLNTLIVGIFFMSLVTTIVSVIFETITNAV